MWRVNQFVTQYIHVHNSVEVVVLFSIAWEEADSGELDIKDDSPNWADGFIPSLVDGCFCMNQLHGVLFPKFILDVETLVLGKVKERRGEEKGAGICSLL